MKRKKTLCSALAVLAGLVLTGCAAPLPTSGGEPQPGTYQTITAEQAKQRMDAEKAPVILDVREPEEYDAAHIPGAVLLPVGDIGSTPPPQLKDLEQEILVYCRSGRRSAQAAAKLAALGYTNVYDFGGIQAWPYETEPTA